MATKKRSTPRTTPQKRRVTMTLEAPEARSVIVAGTFNDWQTDKNAFKKHENGTWKRTLTLEPGVYQYRLIIDGEWRNDPHCTERVVNEFGGENCILRI